MPFLNFLISSNLKKRISKFHFDFENPLESQNNTLISLLNKAKNTSYGKKYSFSEILPFDFKF